MSEQSASIRKRYPKRAAGANLMTFNRSVWHELAVRTVMYVERKHPGPLRYATIADYLYSWGARDAWGRRIPIGTLKRTLKRPKLRQQLADFRSIYRDASNAELLQFDPKMAASPEQLLALAKPATVDFETVKAIERLLDPNQA